MQWNKNDFKVTRINYSQEWIDLNLPLLKQFFVDYVIDRDTDFEKHLAPRRTTIDKQNTISMVNQYVALKAEIKHKQESAELMLVQIVKDCHGKDSDIEGHKLTKIVKKGAVSYAKVVKELLPDADLSGFTGETVEYWRLT